MGCREVQVGLFSTTFLYIFILCPVPSVLSYELPKNTQFEFVTKRTEEKSNSFFQNGGKAASKGEGSSQESITSKNDLSSRSFALEDFPNHQGPDFEMGPLSGQRPKFSNFDSEPSFNRYLNFDGAENLPSFDRSPNPPNFHSAPNPPNFDRGSGRNSNADRRPNSEKRHPNPLNFEIGPNAPNFDRFRNPPNFGGTLETAFPTKPPGFNGGRNSINFNRNPSGLSRHPKSPNLSGQPSSANFPRKPHSSNIDPIRGPGRKPSFDQLPESTRNQEFGVQNPSFYRPTQTALKSSVNRQLKFEPNEDERDFKGFGNFVDESPVWSGADKDPKTIPFPSLPTLDIIEDPGYDHNRPKWPLNEYLTDKFNSFYRPSFFGGNRSNKTENPTKQFNQQYSPEYEWQQLKPLSNNYGSSNSFDKSKYFNLDEEEAIRHRHRHGHKNYLQGYRYADSTREQHPDTNGHTTTVSTTTDIKGSASETAHGGKYGYSSSYGQPHYFPPDYYPKKRFRLSIHPGYIAAPIAGLAAFGAASALAKKPLLFELGLVNNKHHYAQGYPHQGGVHYPGHGWASTVVPVMPGHSQVNPPIINSGNPRPASPTFPILKPEASQVLHGHHLHHHHHSYPTHGLHGHHQGHYGHNQGHYGHNHGHHHPHTFPTSTPDKKPWWNPFAALTPRD